MRQYPIYHKVTACLYKTDKSYGGRDTSEDTILVGSSRSNSYQFVNTKTLRRFFKHPKYGKICIFKYYVDNIKIKEMLFTDNNGKAGKLIQTNSFLKILDQNLKKN